MTYSIYDGSEFESIVNNIVDDYSIDLDVVFNNLKDNEDGDVVAKNIRDTILTSYYNIGFKETYADLSSLSYVGVDSGNIDDRDSKYKIFIGKRAYSGTYSYLDSHDIMNSSLLNDQSSDIYFYNTKRDSISNSKTRLSFISGTNSSLFKYSPYLQSQVVVSGTQSFLSMDIVSIGINDDDCSDISVYSEYGTVSINGVGFPRINELSGYEIGDDYSDEYFYELSSADSAKVLIYSNGSLAFSNISYTSSYIGTSSSELNILGHTVSVNNYNLEFIDDRECTFSIGDIPIGTKFDSKTSILDMLRRMIYDYIPPKCSLSILPPYSSGYVEVGTSPIVKIRYEILKNTLSLNQTTMVNMIPSFYNPITDGVPMVVSGTANGVIISPVINATSSYTITVNDGTQSSSDTKTIRGIYPYFYGFSNLNNMTTFGLSSLSKSVEPLGDKDIDIYGYGNFYFVYDSDYGTLSNIFDESGVTISSSFSVSTITLSSPTGLWSSKDFIVYKGSNIYKLSIPSVNYQFKY